MGAPPPPVDGAGLVATLGLPTTLKLLVAAAMRIMCWR
jgi:hypothetical protein